MALPPLVDVVTFGEWLGHSLDATDTPRAEAVLSAASSLIRSEAGLTWTDESDALETVPDDVQTVTLQVAARVFNNPRGVTQEATGPFSVSYAREGMYLTAGEKAILGRYRTNPRGLWSLSTTRGDTSVDTTYVPVVGTTTEFPWYAGDV